MTATADDAQGVCGAIRKTLRDYAEIATVSVLYVVPRFVLVASSRKILLTAPWRRISQGRDSFVAMVVERNELTLTKFLTVIGEALGSFR